MTGQTSAWQTADVMEGASGQNTDRLAPQVMDWFLLPSFPQAPQLEYAQNPIADQLCWRFVLREGVDLLFKYALN